MTNAVGEPAIATKQPNKNSDPAMKNMLIRSDEWWLALANRVYFWAGVTAAVSAVIAIFATRGIQIYSSRVDAAQKKQIAELNLARTKIEQDLVKQKRHLHSRELFDDEIGVLTQAAKEFKGQRFWIITQTNDHAAHSEQFIFSNQLDTLLTSAGWVMYGNPFGGRMARRVSEPGVEIGSGGDERSQIAASTIAGVLSDFFIATQLVTYSDMSPDIILIDIGLN